MDLNVRAFRTVQEALNEQPPIEDAKIVASRKGGLIGGRARAASLSSNQRKEIAKKASRTRWAKHRST
jgi:hypothetical protein